MARSLPKLILITLLFPLTIFAARSQTSARSLSIEAGPRRSEKLSHLHFYLHEVFASPNFTATQLGPDAGSKLVGRAQGLTSLASRAQLALLMAVNLVFTEGKLQWEHFEYAREEQLGARGEGDGNYRRDGAFQLVRGYVRTKTRSIDRISGLLVSKYNVYILHY
ncbi:dirigent protein 21-like [Eucalyptus grandis]|uniref:dirigent protein 21-like n=1 Tax=Eucalyptus grandis TaxID=71139 RepID=UPI00192E8AD1|nr:dirigent protein 21-like [Eucalyptus grandis]